MRIDGKIESISTDAITRKKRITILTENNVYLPEAQELSMFELLTITFERYTRHRSLNANALLWSCISDLSKAMNLAKWDVYLKLLKDYGTYTYVIVRPGAVEHTKKQWRETEVIGDIEVNGEKAVQLLCYYGSSTYSVDEFKKLLEGTFNEMEQVGLVPPSSQKMQRSLELWQNRNNQ